MNLRQWNKRQRELMTRAPIPDPTPVSAHHAHNMRIFDAWPKPVRDAVNASTYGHSKLMREVHARVKAGQPVKKIIQYIEKYNLNYMAATSKSERDVAEAFLKDIGL